MGQRNNSSFRLQDYFQRLTKSLEFAVSEWLLMFLLFIDACFAYLITKFASHRQLQGPCPLCSRLDRVLAKNTPWNYWDSVCDHHKSEISSFCNVRNSLVGGDGMNPCDDHKSHAAENEKCILVDESLESFRSKGMNPIAPSSEVEAVERRHGVYGLEELKPRHTFPTAELISFDDVPSSNVVETLSQAFVETSRAQRPSEAIKNPVAGSEAAAIPENEPLLGTNGHQMSNHLDLGDAYKLAISTKGRQLSGKLFDQDPSTRVSQDLKLLLSRRSSFQGGSPHGNLISPKLSLNSDELRAVQFLHRRMSLERNESNVSLDGSVVSEVEGESIVDRLRRQVEHDRRVVGGLYRELEEERNASAVATNQAMAMITRLQEEKAALYTEALQCLRVMEEQAEYNGEALQKANEVIEEKEREIRDLGDEIETLRKASR